MSELLAEESAIAKERDRSAARLTGWAVLLAVLITALWGTNPTALKIVLRGFPPIGSAGVRFGIAALGVLAWCWLAKVDAWPRRGEAPWLLVNGSLFIVQIATFTLGVYWGTAGHSIVLLHTYPFFVVALAHFFIPGDRASWGRIAGLVAAFSGILALFIGQGGRWEGTHLLGDVIQVLSAFLLGAQVVFVKHAVARVDPNRVVLSQMALGALVFLAYSFAWEGLAAVRPGPGPIVAMLYQGAVIGTLCFTVWIWLLHRHAASAISVFGFIGPLVGVGLSTLALGEAFTPALGLSAALVAVGVVLGNLG